MTVYTVPGYEREDLDQEIALALWRAGGPDEPLATVIRRRRLCDLLRAAFREHHRALNESVRQLELDGEFVPAVDLMVGGRDPAEIVVARDELRELGAALSASERNSLIYVVAGVPYERDRRVDNAVTRARRKLKAAA